MSKMRSLAMTAAWLAGAGAWNPAAAALAPATIFVDPSEHGAGLYDGGIFSGQELPYQTSISGQTGTFTRGGAIVTLSDLPTPAVTVSATVGAGLDEEVSAIAFVAYYFTITGPADSAFGNVVIPLLIHSKTDVFSSAPTTTTRAVTTFLARNNFYDAFGGATDDIDGDAHHDVDIQFFTLPGLQSRVLIEALVDINNAGGTASATAYIDPTIMIDPSFAAIDPNYLTDFKLTVSDGIGNGGVGGVPEPANWALMLLGFGAIGAALRGRRAGVAVA